jgi:hypothetical protein
MALPAGIPRNPIERRWPASPHGRKRKAEPKTIAGTRPQAHRVHRFFNIPGKRKQIMQYKMDAIIDNIVDNILYTILCIFFDKIITCTIIYILYCRYAFIQGYQKNRRAQWDCGQTPRELLIDRASETSPSAPVATTGPQFFVFLTKDNPPRPHISAYIPSLVECTDLNFLA